MLINKFSLATNPFHGILIIFNFSWPMKKLFAQWKKIQCLPACHLSSVAMVTSTNFQTDIQMDGWMDRQTPQYSTHSNSVELRLVGVGQLHSNTCFCWCPKISANKYPTTAQHCSVLYFIALNYTVLLHVTYKILSY